jgi:LPXTG-motif cell wall-anchored protein
VQIDATPTPPEEPALPMTGSATPALAALGLGLLAVGMVLRVAADPHPRRSLSR